MTTAISERTTEHFEQRIRAALSALPALEAQALRLAGFTAVTADLNRLFVPRRPELLEPVQGKPFFRIVKATVAPEAHVLGSLAPLHVRDIPIQLRAQQVAITIHTGAQSLVSVNTALTTLVFEFVGSDAAIIERRVDFNRSVMALAA